MDVSSIIADAMTEHLSKPADVIDLWKPRSELAAAISVNVDAVHKWAQNNRIPPQYFGGIIKAAQAAGKSITASDLVRVHDNRCAVAVNQSQDAPQNGPENATGAA